MSAAIGMDVSEKSQIILNKTMPVLAVAPDVLISDEATKIFSWINFIVCEIIAIFGTAANILNIICFAKLDLKDAINVSFLGLAISDLGSVVMVLWTNLCMIPAFQESDVPFEPVEFQYLATGLPHVVFTRVTSWITALVTLERCLCITMPLKVKRIINSKRVAIIIVSISIVIIGGVSPLYYSSRLVWLFSPQRNRTLLRVVSTENGFIYEQIANGITNIFIPFSAYAVVITCTIVLVVKLRKKTKWRLTCTAKEDANIMSERDQKVAKMVVMVSTLFIVCFIPLCFTFLAMIIEPRITVNGQFRNTLVVFGGLSILLECANSSLNIFIYYGMSTKYRTVLRHLFKCEQK